MTNAWQTREPVHSRPTNKKASKGDSETSGRSVRTVSVLADTRCALSSLQQALNGELSEGAAASSTRSSVYEHSKGDVLARDEGAATSESDLVSAVLKLKFHLNK